MTTTLHQRVKDQDSRLWDNIAEWMAGGVAATVAIQDTALEASVLLAWDELTNQFGVEDLPESYTIDGHTFEQAKAEAHTNAAEYTGNAPLYQRLLDTSPQYSDVLARTTVLTAIAIEVSDLDEATKNEVARTIDGWFGTSLGMPDPDAGEPEVAAS